MDISVKTGVETYRLKDEHDNVIGEFQMNPTDTNMYSRYQDVSKAFSEFRFDETLAEDDGIIKADNFVREQFDYLFGYKVSEGIFGTVGPLTITADGHLFFANVIDAIGNIVTSITAKRMKKIDAQVKKALERYDG